MTRDLTTGQRLSDDEPGISTARWRGALALLLTVYTLNFLDRQIINILAEQIRLELDLADWQLGLLTGFAFAVFYALAGIPIARLAERGNRRTIIGVSLACWSAFTMLCGMASNFVQLLLFRFGVGVGEAGGVPPAHSLIAEIAPKKKRASALAIFHLGLPVGTLLGLAFGGIIADLAGWRMAFLWAGAPGFVVALFVFAFLPEPRAARKVRTVAPEANGAFGATLRYLITKPTFVLMMLAATVVSFTVYAHQAFAPAFFFRTHGEELQTIAAAYGLKPAAFLGITFGLLSGCFGGLGLWLGGKLADWGARSGLGSYCIVPAVALLLFAPVQFAAFMLEDFLAAILLFCPAILLVSMWIAPMQATVQSVAPRHMRATASALVLLAMNLVGLGLGPLVVGILSDWLSSTNNVSDAQGLQWALAIATSGGLVAAVLFAMARKSINNDVEG